LHQPYRKSLKKCIRMIYHHHLMVRMKCKSIHTRPSLNRPQTLNSKSLRLWVPGHLLNDSLLMMNIRRIARRI
jgi:hypothetical protein